LFLLTGGFDTSIAAYGGEDYEFGCRAQKAGAGFTFLSQAGGYHYRHENSSFAAYLRNGRSVGRNDTIIGRRHPEIVDRALLGLASRPRTVLGRLARGLAFDRPRLGDAAARTLAGVGTVLAWLRWRRPWNRLADCLYQYWYYRGVADVVGDSAAVARYLEVVRGSRGDTGLDGGPA
jgi:GT2 family glycosyltransferase